MTKQLSYALAFFLIVVVYRTKTIVVLKKGKEHTRKGEKT